MNLIRTTTSSSLLLGLALAFTGPKSEAGEPPAAPLKLGGTWKLNQELSEDPARKTVSYTHLTLPTNREV